MPTILALSPHLDDVAFSCGGAVALLVDRGWRAVVATIFTRSVHPAAGFALACQRDKGLADSVDYMALRRDEDTVAMDALGAEARWLDLPEAPHRGYESAPDLFAGMRADDTVHVGVGERIAALLAELRPDLILAPQGLGNHVDHLQLIRAVDATCPAPIVLRYRDTPYAMRLPGRGDGTAVAIGPVLARKLDAACAYASQLGFQFGGAAATRDRLRDFALHEGDGLAAERFRGTEPALAALRAA